MNTNRINSDVLVATPVFTRNTRRPLVTVANFTAKVEDLLSQSRGMDCHLADPAGCHSRIMSALVMTLSRATLAHRHTLWSVLDEAAEFYSAHGRKEEFILRYFWLRAASAKTEADVSDIVAELSNAVDSGWFNA